MAAMKL